MKVIWTQHEASYSGKFVHFESIWSYPKPAQRPHPPVLVGGTGPTVLDRVLAFGDGWFPNYADDEALFERITELRSRADRPIEVQMMAVPCDPAALERLARAGCGGPTTGYHLGRAARSSGTSTSGRMRSASSPADDTGAGAPALRTGTGRPAGHRGRRRAPTPRPDGLCAGERHHLQRRRRET
ncbi:MAG: LLM class flavin-dependent oxidoreductase [Actinobacteria bacterium]|nr:LLM class flavin-dependent oxidoreductase [Actinomycetota bacterium]